MKLNVSLLSVLALGIAALPQVPSGSGGLCPPDGCVIDPTESVPPAKQTAPPQIPSGSGGLCPPGKGCVIDPTTSVPSAKAAMTPSATLADEKRQTGWPLCTIIHGFIHCPSATTTEKRSTWDLSEPSTSWDLGERSSTWDILPTPAAANEKRQAGWPTCSIILGFIHCPTSSIKTLTRVIAGTSSTPTAEPLPTSNQREERIPTYIPVHAVARGEDKTKLESAKRTEANTYPCGTAFGLYDNAAFELKTYYDSQPDDQITTRDWLFVFDAQPVGRAFVTNTCECRFYKNDYFGGEAKRVSQFDDVLGFAGKSVVCRGLN